jgi:hypothetical protein
MYDLRVLHVDVLIPNPDNAQEMDEITFSRLVEEIREVGFTAPITVVDLEDGMFQLLSGEHRWRAAQVVGLDEIPAQVLPLADWDEDLRAFALVRHNVLQGKVNHEKFLALYNRMAAKYGKDAMPNMFAFTDKQQFKKLIGEVGQSLKKSLPNKQMQKEFEERANEARSVDDLGEIIQTLYQKYGDTVNQSFMVFTFGKQEHIYVAMNAKMRKAMGKVLDYVAVSGEDINDVMRPVVDSCARAATKQWEALKKKQEEEGPQEPDEEEDPVAF